MDKTCLAPCETGAAMAERGSPILSWGGVLNEPFSPAPAGEKSEQSPRRSGAGVAPLDEGISGKKCSLCKGKSGHIEQYVLFRVWERSCYSQAGQWVRGPSRFGTSCAKHTKPYVSPLRLKC